MVGAGGFTVGLTGTIGFSVSVFGTQKEGRRGEKVVRRAEEIKKCYRVCGCGGGGGGVGLTNDRLNDLPFTVLRPFSRRPRVTLSFTAQIQPETDSTAAATATVRFVSSFIF